MKLPAYPNYKPTSSEWLGSVPEKWDVLPLKRLVQPLRPITYGIVQCGPHVDGGVPYVRPVDMGDESGVDPESLLRTDAEIAAAYQRSTISAGDIVISIGPSFGKVMIVPSELEGANLTQGTARVAFARNTEPKFGFWALRSSFCWQQWDSKVSGATFRALNLGPLAQTLLPKPPLDVQSAVAGYLDRGTARIDMLVAKKRTLIERLKEKRTALISRTVTRGLPSAAGHDPNPKLKSTGIDWLGDVPEHWVVWKLSHGFYSTGSGTTPPSDNEDWYDGDIPWVTTSELRENVVTDTTKKVSKVATEIFSALKIFPEGALVIAMYGATIGRIGILGVPATTNQACCVMFGERALHTHFMFFWLQAFREQVILLATGGGQPNISQEKIRSLRIPCPSLEEQSNIAEYLYLKTMEIDGMVAKVETAIERLQEYRAALITAAVTGKIDVRGAGT